MSESRGMALGLCVTRSIEQADLQSGQGESKEKDTSKDAASKQTSNQPTNKPLRRSAFPAHHMDMCMQIDKYV